MFINLIQKYSKEMEKTDKLIDQLVYKLYGLSEEDIDIIEKSLNKNNQG